VVFGYPLTTAGVAEMKPVTGTLGRNLVWTVLALVLASGCLHAGITEDWQTCLNTVLNRPGTQNRTDAFSEYCVGLGYMQGHFGQRDQVSAARYHRMAADQNLPAAEVALGYAYERGYGVPKDHATAISWWRKAAAAKSADANFLLGECYESGSGVPKDQAQANSYYRIAAQLGNEQAKRKISTAGYQSSPGIDLVKQGNDMRAAKNYAGAVEAFRKAAEFGNPYGEGSLGSMYEAGWGVPQSYQQAALWYTKAANKGLPEAQKRIGQLNELGEGMPENWAVSLAWYRKGAAQHDPESEFALGRMYEYGMAVPQNRDMAIQWFQAAAAQGDSQAAYFARWLSVPTNNIGFRSADEQKLVIGGRLPFAAGADDPSGIEFHNSAERLAWLNGLRNRQVQAEHHALWQVDKNKYDDCKRNHGDDCRNPGPPPPL